jgi:hypothetical protein
MSNLDSSDEEYADAVFRMGQCLVELGRWSEALVHFQILYDAAVEFEESNKNMAIPPGMRVLDKKKLARWIEKVRPHVPEADRLPSAKPSGSTSTSDEDLYAKIAAEPLQPQKPLETRASLMGRDADVSWFRFVIPASKVMWDDSPTGAHDFLAIDPSDSFPTTQQEIYEVFGLVSASYEAVPLTAQCFWETSEVAGQQRALAQDRVVMSTNDQSGYFLLSRPETGWMPGLYRGGLFEGERMSAYAHVDEVRCRIMEPGQAS